MNIPVSKDMSTKRGLVEVWIEETMDLEFDLSGNGQYVDTGAVEGRIQVDFEIDRTELMDRLGRANSPSVRDRLNALLEDWSLDAVDTETATLDYGMLLVKGAEPTELESTVELNSTFSADELRSTSPGDLKRELRQERTYETTYDDLAEDVGEYLEKEGVAVDPSFSAPVHVQATAIPAKDGTDFTIAVENNELTPIGSIVLKVDMPPEIGRQVRLGHANTEVSDQWTSEPAVSGTYDPEERSFRFQVKSLSPTDEGGSSRELRFHVPARAQATLDELSGEAQFTRYKPFSNIEPVAVFDAGGHRLGTELGGVDANGHIEATFSTPTEAITVGSAARARAEFQIKGVAPTAAFTEIEDIIKERGIEGASYSSPTQSRDMREGQEVTKFSGSIKNGSVLVGDTRISVNINVNGDVRSADRETARETDENLPAERRSVTVEYGRTGVKIRAEGTDQEVVDDYVTDLRDELRVSLQSIAEAM